MVFLEPEVWLTAMGQQKKFDPLSKKLIKHMLGFEEEEENFIRSEQYIISNLLYHNYTAVNRHAVQRSIKGLELKFEIHGQKDRSENLKNLIDKFTSSSCFKDHPEVDVEWAIISLLLQLSNSPTSVPPNQDYQPPSTVRIIEDTEEDDIDWVAYLKEDNQTYSLDPDDDLSDWSNDDEENVSNIKSVNYGEASGIRESTTQNPVVNSLSSLVNKQTEEGRAWLAENCQPPYWLNVNSDNCINTNGAEEVDKTLSEWVVMREILWMLVKPVPAVLFYTDEKDRFCVNSKFTVSSLSKTAFQSYLEQLCEPLNQLKDIDNFFNHLEDQQQAELINEPNVSATVLAYASGLRLWRHEFWSHLSILEEKVKKQEETCTLLWLENELTSWFQKIYAIHDVHSSAILEADSSTQAKAVRLLGVFCEGIVRAVKVDIRTILLRLFLHSLRHYLRLMHHWLYEGLLQDYTNEFIIHRNNKISVFEGNFWSSAFTLDYKALLEASEGDSPIKTTLRPLIPILESLICVGKTRELLVALISNNSSYDEVKTPHLVAKDINCIIASSSLQQLIKQPNTSLEEQVINHIKEAVMTSSPVQQKEEHEEIVEPDENEIVSSQEDSEVAFLLCEWQERDPLLLAAFPDIHAPLNNEKIQPEVNKYKRNLLYTDKISQYIESITADHSKSVVQLLVSALRPLIAIEQHTLSAQLTQIFKFDHQLSLHFNAVRSVILMEAGDVMHEFYSHIFSNLEKGETMGSDELTLHLQCCLSRLYPDLAHRFSISVDSEDENIPEDTGGEDIDPAERQRRGNLKRLKIGLPDIKIHYEVPWPISLVMTEDIWERCNKLFAFTLSLKRATYGMERLQFRELASWQSIMSSSMIIESSSKELGKSSLNPLQSRLHRLQLLRHWLLYFSHSVHDHFANSVFMPYHVAVETLLAGEPSLDTIIKEHEKLLQEICNQSLLTNERRSPLNMILGRIFELMMKLGDVWRRDVGSLSSATLCGLEEEYSVCHGFLANFLITLTKTHHIPHMAGLTHAIVSSTPVKVNNF